MRHQPRSQAGHDAIHKISCKGTGKDESARRCLASTSSPESSCQLQTRECTVQHGSSMPNRGATTFRLTRISAPSTNQAGFRLVPRWIPPRTKIAKPAHATRQQRKARCYSTTRNLTVVPTQKWTRCVLTTATTLRILPTTLATAPTRVGPGAGPVNWTAERGQNAGPSSRARSPRAGGAARCGCLAGDDQSASLERHGVFCDNPFFCWRLRNHRARPRHRRHAVTRRPSMVVPSVTWRPGVTRRPAVTRRPRQWADQVLRRRPKQRVNQF